MSHPSDSNAVRSCPYPFSQLTIAPTGQYKLCCSSSEAFGPVTDYNGEFQMTVKDTPIKDYWQSGYLNWVRENHVKGQKIKECESCYFYERHGNESYRERAIRELGSYKSPLASPVSLDLKLGNKCNASCLFCDPSSSSTVLAEWKKIGWDKKTPFDSGLTGRVSPELFDVDYDWAESPEFWNQLKTITPGIRNLKFTGGEPLINRYMMAYLEWVIENGYSRDMRLQVTTNGILVPRQFLDLLDQFREVEINFSVDGYGKQNEYIRYPTRWEKWLENVKRVEKSVGDHVNLNFQHSVSVYSVFGLEKYFTWMWPYKRFGFHLFKVFHPIFQRTEVLTPIEKLEIVGRLQVLAENLRPTVECDRDLFLLGEISGIAKMIKNEPDWSHKKPDLKGFIDKIDTARGISIWNYMPEAAKSIGVGQPEGFECLKNT